MLVLIKNAHVFAPNDLGVKEILIANGKIIEIADKIEISYKNIKTIDANGKILAPGIIDKHIHITGGGGEAGFKSKVPEIKLSQLVKAGITTVVGLLGTDSTSRNVESLLAKTKGLKEQGMNAYCLTGAYEYPSPTITGSVKKDIAMIDEIIGTKIALNDHRDSAISVDELARLALDTRVGGMMGGKKSFLTIHLGSGKSRLSKIDEVLKNNYISNKLFQVTHVGRDKDLFYDCIEFNQKGGYIDISADGNYTNTTELFEILKTKKANFDLITITSDGNGSWSEYDENGNLIKIGAARCDLMLKLIATLTKENILSFEQALQLGTKNVARSIGIDAGEIKVGANADFIILDKDYELDSVIINGKVFLENKQIIVKGMFEE